MEKQRQIGQYIIGKEIGEGTFGKVRIGVDTLT
jgi:serine/threonine protein kinase